MIDRRRRMLLAGSAVVYLLFVIYGSLVPLAYRPVPWAEALARFRDIPYLALGIASRADWVANILLFIPLAFLWRGVLDTRRGILVHLLADGAVLAGCVALSVGIEFTQIFFPPRTVSLNDIIAEGIGAAVGVVVWRAAGRRLVAWLEEWRGHHGSVGLAERFCILYFVCLFGYNLLPLDLTISPVEVFHKWRQGRVLFIPGIRGGEGPLGALYEMATDAAVWVPAAWLLVRAGKGGRAWWITVGAAAGLEFLQLFVFSRVTDVNDVIMAALGGWVGMLLAGRQSLEAPAATRKGRAMVYWGGAAIFWCAVIAAVFWYPFDFRPERGFVLERIAMFRKVPFHALYYGSEFHAVTEVLRKTLFFAPLGACVAGVAHAFQSGLAGRIGWVAALLLAGSVAAGVEVGQLALPGHYPDSTDILIGTVAGLFGYGLSRFVRRRLGQVPVRDVKFHDIRENR